MDELEQIRRRKMEQMLNRSQQEPAGRELLIRKTEELTDLAS